MLYERHAALTDTQYREPPDEVQDGKDNVVRGEFPDHLKRSYTLLCLLDDEHKSAVSEMKSVLDAVRKESSPLAVLRKIVDDDKLEGLFEKHRSIHEDLEIARSLFWADMRRQFPELADKTSIGVRKGWLACWSEERDGMPHDLMELLGDGFEIINIGGRFRF
jgi:hypothetical protein